VRPQCSGEVVSESASPNLQWVASIMQRRCGEEEPFVTHINLRPTARPIRYGFFSGKAQDGEIFSIEQDADALHLDLVWNSSDQLTIHCGDCVNARNKQARWGSVSIRFE